MSKTAKVNTKEAEAENMKEEQTQATEDTEDINQGEASEAKETTGETETEAGSPEEKKTEEDEELQSRYLRLAADFQNFKRRTEKEKSDIYAFANEKIMTDLFDVIDNFDRAIAGGKCTDESFLKGMELILKQFKGVLEKNGLEEMKAEGEDFDPNYHNAVMMEDVEGVESGKVTEVLQKGYILNKKVIRPAMVKVAN